MTCRTLTQYDLLGTAGLGVRDFGYRIFGFGGFINRLGVWFGVEI